MCYVWNKGDVPAACCMMHVGELQHLEILPTAMTPENMNYWKIMTNQWVHALTQQLTCIKNETKNHRGKFVSVWPKSHIIIMHMYVIKLILLLWLVAYGM